MGKQVAERAISTAPSDEGSAHIDNRWRESLLQVMRDIVHKLPDHTTLGELVEATRSNSHLAPLLSQLSVQELIDMAQAKPRSLNLSSASSPAEELPVDDELPMDDGGLNGGPAVIRRRADVPDGDLLILRTLFEQGALSESAIGRNSQVTSEQLRLLLRHLRSKGLIHIEGSGVKRKIKITRNGSNYLRKRSRRRS